MQISISNLKKTFKDHKKMPGETIKSISIIYVFPFFTLNFIFQIYKEFCEKLGKKEIYQRRELFFKISNQTIKKFDNFFNIYLIIIHP